MALCLLSRRLCFLVFRSLLSFLQLAKVLISLVFVLRLLQLSSSTSQPMRQKPRFRGQPSYLFSPNFERCTARVCGSLDKSINAKCLEHSSQFVARYGCSQFPDIRFRQFLNLRQLPDIHPGMFPAATHATLFPFIDVPQSALKSHAFTQALASNLSVEPSSNSFTHNPPECLVCDLQSSGSCPVCGQDFCSTHLYLCADCGNQYCSNCFDDHNSDGHWTDSDTAAELSHTQHSVSKHAAARYRVSAAPLASDHSCDSGTSPATVSQLMSLLFFKGLSACQYLLGPSSVPGYLPQCKLLPEVLL